MMKEVRLEALQVLPSGYAGAIYDITYWNAITGQWVISPPTVPVGSAIGALAKFMNLGTDDQLMRLDFTFIRPDNTEQYCAGNPAVLSPNEFSLQGFTLTADQSGNWKVRLELDVFTGI